MWIAVKPFRYRGVAYNAGDTVPAETWANRKAFVAMRKIRLDPDPLPVSSPAETPPVALATMKRGELNSYGLSLGILDAEGYSNRESLIEAIEALTTPTEESDEEEEDEGVLVDDSGTSSTESSADDSDDFFAPSSDKTD